MKKYLFILLVLSLVNIGFSQSAIISKNLNQAKAKSSDLESHRVIVELNDNVNFDMLRSTTSINSLPLEKRAKAVVSILKNKSFNTQELVLADAFIKASNGRAEIEVVKRYWIVNVMVLDINNAMIQYLMNHPSIKSIDLENSVMLKPLDEIQKSSV